MIEADLYRYLLANLVVMITGKHAILVTGPQCR